ncbi:oligodendrocyte-myelin glycoprotein [Leucoraja erinacea]|uniref:oligodendrocyte-myelin glycoprotein n=1 Tax=Leucoraja erinaceus TaxID=7782 RepID=UPI002458F240|nr:oligodendrocyte-myelin glycoprotein [Leucoraja erinacea]
MGFSKLTRCFLALLSVLSSAAATCPLECLCSHNARHIDCSGRNLTALPNNIQTNIISLNLSHNAIEDLDDRLTEFINLRFLDISNNNLSNMPTLLPLALWELDASNNYIKTLQKDDTVSQWNLIKLDVSNNLIERAFLINNTLINLKSLNFSGNKFWTVPTNMPYNLSTLDLSHNNLHNILPDTFHHKRLLKLYLNNNSLQFIPSGTVDQLTGLELISLYGNNWACNDGQNVHLLRWLQTVPTVLGCPCTAESKRGQSGCNSGINKAALVSSTFTSYQSLIGTTTSTRHKESTVSTPYALASQNTNISSLSDSVSYSQLYSTASSFTGGTASPIPTRNITLQTASTESPSELVSTIGDITERLPSTTVPITAPEFTSNSTVFPRSTATASMSSAAMDNQTSRLTSPSTFDSTSIASRTSPASAGTSMVSMVTGPSVTNATTSHGAEGNTSSPFQVVSSSLTTRPMVNGITGIKSTVHQIVTTPKPTSKAHRGTGRTCFMVLSIMLLLVV